MAHESYCIVGGPQDMAAISRALIRREPLKLELDFNTLKGTFGVEVLLSDARAGADDSTWLRLTGVVKNWGACGDCPFSGPYNLETQRGHIEVEID